MPSLRLERFRLCAGMLERSVLALSIIGVALLATSDRAAADIVLTANPETPIMAAPDLVATADFNRDGRMDLAALESGSSTITLLLGANDGTLGAPVRIPMAPRMLGFAAGDVNGDGNPDLVAVTNYLDSVFVANGNGQGTFVQYARYDVGQHPVAVAIGNFDRASGNDLVTANQDVDTVTVLLNLGGNRGFTRSRDFRVGNRPKRVVTGDLNGDGADDIVVVNTDGNPNDTVSVLLNTGNGQFKTQTIYDVGERGTDVLLTDVNNDGAPDMLVLNSKDVSGRASTFTVSVFFNRLQTDTDRPLGTGLFDPQPTVTVTCPRNIGGISAFCTPNLMTAGDYDADGFVDLVVSYQILANSGGAFLTAGYIAALAGAGDGTFSQASQVTVGVRPEGVASADFNGDAVSDIAIAEQGEESVRLVFSVPPPMRSTGSLCTAGSECASTHCVDGVCCESAACPEGQSCKVPDEVGHCSPVAANGVSCTTDLQCASEACVDRVCCASPVCNVSESCNVPGHAGTCAPVPTPTPTPTPVGPGAGMPCNLTGTPPPCSGSLFCLNGTCCVTSSCPAGERCDILGFSGDCAPPLAAGQPCEKDTDCATGLLCVLDAVAQAKTCGSAGTTTPTATPSAPTTPVPTHTAGSVCEGACPCVGDCNTDIVVTVDEVLTVVGIAVGDASLDVCAAGDPSGDGHITVDEVLMAVTAALDGCP